MAAEAEAAREAKAKVSVVDVTLWKKVTLTTIFTIPGHRRGGRTESVSSSVRGL